MMLSDATSVAQRYRRSIRIDTDLDSPAALDGFIDHESNRAVIGTMARLISESGQRAFTLTGPYGGGKSSLALAISAMVSRDKKIRKRIREQLGNPVEIRKALHVGRDEWLVVPVVGRRSDPVEDIGQALSKAIGSEIGRSNKKKNAKRHMAGRDVIDLLVNEANNRASGGGVMLVVDELGKFLEGASDDSVDIHFFQELAESANRCEGNLIVLGILHQSFEQYAGRLGRETQDEWAKVQGRFIDIPFITAIDEVIDLTGRAIKFDHTEYIDRNLCKKVASAISKRRPGSPANLAERLEGCWPLHPVTAALLGPVSRGRFAQNERSVFGFLGSAEPLGFQEFLRDNELASGISYTPDRLWDYLRANLEPSIMASPDGHRWVQAVEAVERCETRGNTLHIRLAKSTAVIDLFRDGTGIMAEQEILRSCKGNSKVKDVDSALRDLSNWSVTVFRNHLDAWAIYAGSDFDIHSAVETARIENPIPDFKKLRRLTHMSPLLAKEHYYRTGTLRWFETEILPLHECENAVSNFAPAEGSAGKFLLAVPSGQESDQECRKLCAQASRGADKYPVAVGYPRNAWLLRSLGLEITALEEVQRNSPELEGDAVARRELDMRLAASSDQFFEELRKALCGAEWYIHGKHRKGLENESDLSRLMSTLANETFIDAPIINSELINRIRPSSNIQGAVRQLLYRMIDGANREHLGIEGFKAERGIYSTVLESSGLHLKKSGRYRFAPPNKKHQTGKSFVAMWKEAESLIDSENDSVAVSELYRIWSRPPFGIRQGVLPILAMAFALAQRDSVAVYVDNMFQPELNDVFADKLLQDSNQIQFRRVRLSGQNKGYLECLAVTISQILNHEKQTEALSVARELVRFAFSLPMWTRRTKTVSKSSQQVRDTLLRASDPHQTLFVDLPMIYDANPDTMIANNLADALRELLKAYTCMLSDLRFRMLKALEHKHGNNFANLHKRAATVSGLSGDLRLEAFASRLSQFSGTDVEMESIASLAINKPPRDWSDRDPEQAALVIADFALKFRHAEVLAKIKDREPTRHALGIVFGTGEKGRTLMKSFDIAADDEDTVESLCKGLLEYLNDDNIDNHLLLAALARTGANLMEQLDNEENEAKPIREVSTS